MTGLPMVWAQVSGTNSAASLALLSLRRWCSSLTLSSPEPVPSLAGLWAWLGGLLALLLLASVFQGPVLAVRQLLDVPGHVRLLLAAVSRLRRSWRVVAVTIGMTVLAWTGSQIRTYNLAQGRDDLILLTKSRGLGELAFEQGVLAGLTPLRDVFGLADNLPLLALATFVLFRVSVVRWGEPYVPMSLRTERGAGWVEVLWTSGSLYILYRMVAIASGRGDLPVGGCVILEVAVVPLLMLTLDGAIVGWLLVELRNASLGDAGNDALAPEQAIGLLPGAALACLAALPARYLATALTLLSDHLPSTATSSTLGRYLRWQLMSSGLTVVQAGALMLVGIAGVVAWSRGTLGGALRGYVRLLGAEGGHLAGLLALAGLAAGSLASVAYVLVLSLPVQTWVLAAADGYAHYATLPIGLTVLAALVELAERSLPTATLAQTAELAAESVPV